MGAGVVLSVAGGAVPVTGAHAIPKWVSCIAYLNARSVLVPATARTVTVVRQTSTTYATLGFYVRTDAPCGFTRAFRDTAARLGYAGTEPGETREQGSGTTPLGIYSMTEAFGLAASPGGSMPYHRVVSGDYWVQDRQSSHYNTLRNKSQGGFRYWLSSSSDDSSEYLPSYPTQYQHSIVVNFNRSPDSRVIGRGSGIFVHVNGSGATAGCVSSTLAGIQTMLREIRAGDRIHITR